MKIKTITTILQCEIAVTEEMRKLILQSCDSISEIKIFNILLAVCQTTGELSHEIDMSIFEKYVGYSTSSNALNNVVRKFGKIQVGNESFFNEIKSVYSSTGDRYLSFAVNEHVLPIVFPAGSDAFLRWLENGANRK